MMRSPSRSTSARRRPGKPGRTRWAARTWSWALLLTVGVPSSGCYQYTRVRPDALLPGQEVRLVLAEDASEQLGDALGDRAARQGSTIEGDVLAIADQHLLVAVPLTPQAASVWELPRSLHQRTAIPLQGVMEVEVRQLDRKKTLLVASGTGTVLALFSVYMFTGWFGGTTKAVFPDPGPVELTVPVPLLSRD